MPPMKRRRRGECSSNNINARTSPSSNAATVRNNANRSVARLLHVERNLQEQEPAPRRSQRIRTMAAEAAAVVAATESVEAQSQSSSIRQGTPPSIASITASATASSASPSPPHQQPSSSSQNNGESSTSTSSLSLPNSSSLETATLASVSLRQQQSEPGFDDAIDLVMKVKHRFRYDKAKYSLFLTILHKFQSKDYNLAKVCELVLQLFRNHPDLLEGFLYFLPDPLIAKAIMPFGGSLDGIQQKQERSTKHEDKTFGPCIVCSDQPRSIAFVPCGHLCVCQSCASKCITQSGSCPICNQKTATTMRIYLS